MVSSFSHSPWAFYLLGPFFLNLSCKAFLEAATNDYGYIVLSSDIPLETDIGSIVLKQSSRSAENDPDYLLIDSNNIRELNFELEETACNNTTVKNEVIIPGPCQTNVLWLDSAIRKIKELVTTDIGKHVIKNGTINFLFAFCIFISHYFVFRSKDDTFVWT